MISVAVVIGVSSSHLLSFVCLLVASNTHVLLPALKLVVLELATGKLMVLELATDKLLVLELATGKLVVLELAMGKLGNLVVRELVVLKLGKLEELVVLELGITRSSRG